MSAFYRFTKFHLESYPSYGSFYYESSQKCLYHTDFVLIIDESYLKINNTQEAVIYCGVLDKYKLPEFVSKTNNVYVQFISDSSRSGSGFEAEIKFTYGRVVHFLNYLLKLKLFTVILEI